MTPVGATEIAERLGLDRDTVKTWQRRHESFPPPRWTVGGRPAWDWTLDISPWLLATGRGTDRGVEAGWQRNFRLASTGGDVVRLEQRTDDGWVLIAEFVGDLAFPAPELVETAGDKAALVAWQHLQAWERMRVRHGRLAPGEQLPDWLIPQQF